MIGKQLAHYQIESRLGAGGMGEVYLAQDTRLRRKVALKLLPNEQIGDPEKLARFEQEARATSALNHPNITTIFETGDVDDAHYIAIEYIEGRTLRELMDAGHLELRKVLDIAVQIADGLAAAHEANVVHRDLKPENVMVREDGIVKILDFGLAKLASRLMDDEEPVDEDETLVGHGPAGSGSLTDPGMVLGTVSYMSPEQARGEAVDFRSDIFSFGSVLYEALARKRAFQRDSSAETMTAIIREAPTPLQELAPDTPPEFVRIIRKAMAKDVNERYQSGKDLSLDLRALRREVDSGSVSAQWAATSGSAPAARSNGRRGVIGLVALVVIIAATLPLWNRDSSPPVAAVGELEKEQVTASGHAIRGALSPGGRILAFIERHKEQSSLSIRQLGAGTDARLIEPTTDRIGNLTFTPDGEWLLFTRRPVRQRVAHLYRIALVGGQPREILGDIASTPSFAPDGNRFVFQRIYGMQKMGFWVASLDGSSGDAEFYSKPEDVLGFGDPIWSPDGSEIAFQQVRTDGLFRPKMQILNLETGEVEALPHPEWVRIYGMQWKRDGSGIYVTAQRQWQSKTHVFEVRRDGSGATHVTRGFDDYMFPSLAANGQSMAVTRNSFSTSILSIPITGTTLENTVGVETIVGGTGHNNDGSFSPDGSRVAFLSSTTGDLNIWTMKPDGSDRRQLTFNENQVFSPYYSPDGKSIAYGAEKDGNLQVWIMDADGRNRRQVTFGDLPNYSHSWSPDSQWLSFIKMNGPTGQIYKVRVASESDSLAAPELVSEETAYMLALWSPDGEWILTWTGFGGPGAKPTLKLLAADGSGRTLDIDTSDLSLRGSAQSTGAFQFLSMRWGKRSDRLYCVQNRDGALNLVRLNIADGAVTPLTQFKNEDMVFSFSVAPNEEQVIMTRGHMTDDIVILRNLPGASGEAGQHAAAP